MSNLDHLHREFCNAVCESLGLVPEDTYGVTIEIRPSGTKVTVDMAIDPPRSFVSRLRSFRLVPTEVDG